MATYTTNYHLKKPGGEDNALIGDLNDNFDTIDTKIKEAADAIPPVATVLVAGIVKPDGTTVTVDNDGTIHGAQTYVLPIATASMLGGVRIGQNLTINAAGVLSAYAAVQTDAQPTQNSQNVPLSGGTWTMINTLNNQVSVLENSVAGLTLGLIWKDSVATYADIASTYTTPAQGWTVCANDTGYIWWYDGSSWIHILTFVDNVATTAEVTSVLTGAAT